MADAPDLSRIVGGIMEHPEIVGQISALLSPEVGSETESKPEVEATTVSAAPKVGRRSDRARLLGAMKPYLSESRARAVDTMITVTEILESMKGGG